MTSGRAPVEPDAGAVEKQYGDDADLYAEVRAETAKAIGRASAAQDWKRVQAGVEADQENDVEQPG